MNLMLNPFETLARFGFFRMTGARRLKVQISPPNLV